MHRDTVSLLMGRTTFHSSAVLQGDNGTVNGASGMGGHRGLWIKIHQLEIHVHLSLFQQVEWIRSDLTYWLWMLSYNCWKKKKLLFKMFLQRHEILTAQDKFFCYGFITFESSRKDLFFLIFFFLPFCLFSSSWISCILPLKVCIIVLSKVLQAALKPLTSICLQKRALIRKVNM